MTAVRDVAAIRLDNALLLFDEFVQATVKHADAATLRGLERRFAERLQIQPSYWSQIKGRSRQIGERLARQFEQCSHKPAFWMDEPHVPAAAPVADDRLEPRDDDERFITGLVLAYYRRNPQRARSKLMDLLGEVLAPPPPTVVPPAVKPLRPAPTQATAPTAPAPADDPMVLWRSSQSGVAPLKKKR